jgi:hypothetical protein
MLREVKEEDFVGKTITSVNIGCVNVIHFTFSDGTNLSLWAEDVITTSAGNIPGFLVSDESEESEESEESKG